MNEDNKNNRHSGLGMGLSGLLGINQSIKFDKDFIEIEIDNIIPNPNQPRKHFSNQEIMELSQSIKDYGLIQPIIVRKLDNDLYQIIAGERRFRACRYAGLPKIKCIVRNDISDDFSNFIVAIIENLQREDLNLIEEAEAYKELTEQFNITQNEIAHKVKKSRPHVANMLRIANMKDGVKKYIVENKIPYSHARVIATYDDPMIFLEEVVNNNLSVKDLERFVKDAEIRQRAKKENENTNKIDDEFRNKLKTIELILSEKFDVQIRFTEDKKQKKDIDIYYSDPKKLNVLFNFLLKESIEE